MQTACMRCLQFIETDDSAAPRYLPRLRRQQSGSLPESGPENNLTLRMAGAASCLISHYREIHGRVKSGESIIKISPIAWRQASVTVN